MAKVITVTDFEGRYLTAKDSYNILVLNDYIARFEPLAIARLLGAELATAFSDDIPSDGGTPTDPLFITLYDPLQFNANCGGLYYSAGMKDYVLGIVFFHYMVEQRLQPSITTGSVQNVNENATFTLNRQEIYERYNTSVTYGKAIQRWCCDHRDDYPDYRGIKLLYNYQV